MTAEPRAAISRVAATVAGRQPEARGVERLTVAPAGPLGHRPGQFAEITKGDEVLGFFAIASAPREGGDLVFLVKPESATSDALGALGAGDALTLRGPFGRPFPIGAAEGADVLLVGAGTALAPMRAALVELIARRDRYGEITLVHGARTEAERLFLAEHRGWEARGVRLRVVLSQPEGAWRGRTGWVQHHLDDLIRPGCWAFVAGMSEMERATLARLVAGGVAAERALTNVDAATLDALGLG